MSSAWLKNEIGWLLAKPSPLWTEKEWDFFRMACSPPVIKDLLYGAKDEPLSVPGTSTASGGRN